MAAPRHYYNEIDKFCAEWLYRLIAANLLPPGDIDTRDIRDVLPTDLAPYTQCHFFAGIGGWPLALANAGVGRDVPLWTGSCPCQPFSAAGKRGGFADERHLWPSFHHLIAQCRPPTILGEQVASASDWLGLVRGDLEALDYAVGCCPVEAASAGADHLRDRFWFVGDLEGERWREGGPEHVVRSGRATASIASSAVETNRRLANAGRGRRGGSGEGQDQQPRRTEVVGAGDTNGVGLADAHNARSQGRIVLRERAGERPAGADGVADSECEGPFSGAHSGIHCEQESARPRHVNAERRSGVGNVANSGRTHGERRSAPEGLDATEASGWIENSVDDQSRSSGIEWVVGADGKARRVKSGVRLLVNGFPNRVGLLRGFGNAIDPRPAEKFIRSYFESRNLPP